jgi:hypothetical protein
MIFNYFLNFSLTLLELVDVVEKTQGIIDTQFCSHVKYLEI